MVNNKYNAAMDPRYYNYQVKQVKSKKSWKLIDQEYFAVATHDSIFFVASMEAKTQLDTSYDFRVFKVKAYLTI